MTTKLTVKQASEKTGIPETLIRAVVRQTGRENLPDIANHGVGGGFAGFTYYTDTVPFFKAHRKQIVALVERMAEDLGENPAEMVASFNCLGGRDYKANEFELTKELREWLPSVSRCLYGGRLTDDDTQVANALAWFAAEEVARAFEE